MCLLLCAGLIQAVLMSLPAAPTAEPPSNSFPGKELLSTTDRVEVLSLDPGPHATRYNDPKAKQLFQGWPVLGSTGVTDAAARKTLAAMLVKAAADSKEFERALCFEPRHGIRVVVERRKVDWVICFRCSTIKAYVDDRQVASAATKGTPEVILDKLLRDAGVALAPKASEER
jgi:hypothetical protein